MIRLLLKCSFSKKLVFESKKGSKTVFEKRKPKRDLFESSQNPLSVMDVKDRLQILFDRYKTEKKFNQNKFDEILKVRENFLTQKIPKQQFYYFINTRFNKDQLPEYFHFQCQMIDEYFQRFEVNTTEQEFFSILTSISNGLFFVEKQVFSVHQPKVYNEEAENFIINIFFRLCDKIEINLEEDSAVKLACQMMKYTKRYHLQFLDRINQELLKNEDISFDKKIYYTLILVKAGSQYFPEIVYKMRDEILTDKELNKQSGANLFNYFEIFGRTRLPLTQLALTKLFTAITSNEAYFTLKPQQRILLLYYTSKSPVIGSERLVPFIEDIISKPIKLSGTTLKVFVLTLFNMNYQNLIALQNMEKQNSLKTQLSNIVLTGTFNQAELKYIQGLINIL